MSHKPFHDRTRWRQVVGAPAFAALCLGPVALASAVVIEAGPTAPIGVLALVVAAFWTGLGVLLTRIALPMRASIQVDELGIKVDGRKPLVLPWAAIRGIGLHQGRGGRDYVLLRPARDVPLPARLPPHVHLRPVERVLLLDLDGWRNPDGLRAALQTFTPIAATTMLPQRNSNPQPSD